MTVVVPFLAQFPSPSKLSDTSKPHDRNNCIFLIPSDWKQLRCPHELTSDWHTEGLVGLCQALRGSGGFNLLSVFRLKGALAF